MVHFWHLSIDKVRSCERNEPIHRIATWCLRVARDFQDVPALLSIDEAHADDF